MRRQTHCLKRSLRRREAAFALTRLQIAALSSPHAFHVFFPAFLCLRISLFREAQFGTVPRTSQRPQNRRLKYTANACLIIPQ